MNAVSGSNSIKTYLVKAKQFVILLCLFVAVSACGFQLRGQYLLSEELQTLYVSSTDVHGELTRLVKLHLKRNNVNVIKRLTDNSPELRIVSDKLDRRTLSVFENGQVAEYEIIYAVNYYIRFANEDPIKFHFELNRDYQDDPDFALAKSRELSLLLSEMRKSAADKILRDMAQIHH